MTARHSYAAIERPVSRRVTRFCRWTRPGVSGGRPSTAGGPPTATFSGGSHVECSRAVLNELSPRDSPRPVVGFDG